MAENPPEVVPWEFLIEVVADYIESEGKPRKNAEDVALSMYASWRGKHDA